MPVVVSVDSAALLALADVGGPIHTHFVVTLVKVDAKSKLEMSGQMVHVRTGNLRSSQTPPRVLRLGGRIVGTLENTASYALAVHDGTKPHDIAARNAKALRFIGSDGQPTFRAVVHHPGTKPRPFLRKPLYETIAGV